MRRKVCVGLRYVIAEGAEVWPQAEMPALPVSVSRAEARHVQKKRAPKSQNSASLAARMAHAMDHDHRNDHDKCNQESDRDWLLHLFRKRFRIMPPYWRTCLAHWSRGWLRLFALLPFNSIDAKLHSFLGLRMILW